MQTLTFQLYVTNMVHTGGVAKLLRPLFNLNRQKTGAASIITAGDSTSGMQD